MVCTIGPEVLIEPAQDAAAQGGNGIGTIDSPMYAGSFAAGADQRTPASFGHSGSDDEDLAAEIGVLHALAIVFNVVGTLGGRGERVGGGVQHGEDVVEVAIGEFVADHVGPQAGMVGLAHIVEMRFTVPRYALFAR